jgi:thioredoxin-related protein
MPRTIPSIFITVVMAASAAWGQAAEQSFAPFEQWKAAILAQDAPALKALYSTDPAAQVRVSTVIHPADADINFWLALKAKSMKISVVRYEPRHGHISFIFRAEVLSGLPNGQTVNVTEDQSWQQQGDQWRLIYVERTDSPRLPQPANMKKDLYPADVDAHAEIKEAEEKAAREHKRLLLVVGANWCFDCHVLDLAFHRPDLAPIIAANYEVVHLDIGPDGNKNADVLKQFDISLDKGVPVVVVAESDGRVVVNEKNGEFEDARQLTPEFLLEFLNKWKPQAR